ncbi:MAG TPA: hypothetical protein PLO16_12695 [Acidocella sp.]|nr:hypothetical protein [Acidocella sp.]
MTQPALAAKSANTCHRTGCHRDATGTLLLLVPALFGPIDRDKCAHVRIGVRLCDGCFEVERPKLWCNGAVRQNLREMTVAQGLQVPDFKRAYLKLERFDG